MRRTTAWSSHEPRPGSAPADWATPQEARLWCGHAAQADVRQGAHDRFRARAGPGVGTVGCVRDVAIVHDSVFGSTVARRTWRGRLAGLSSCSPVHAVPIRTSISTRNVAAVRLVPTGGKRVRVKSLAAQSELASCCMTWHCRPGRSVAMVCGAYFGNGLSRRAPSRASLGNRIRRRPRRGGPTPSPAFRVGGRCRRM